MWNLTIFESICAGLAIFLAVSPAFSFIYQLLRGSQFNPKGKHVYVTGGSIGLGRAVALELAKQGAHVTVVARKQGPLEETVQLMKDAAKLNNLNIDQKFNHVSADLADKKQAIRALDEASAKFGGQVPDYIFTCAGLSIPKLFVDSEVEDFEKQMSVNYFGTLYTVHEAAKRMVNSGIQGQFVMVASTMGFTGFAGYSSYAPTKFALRGLAECLRNEFLMYGIKTNIYYPGTMFTPGYDTENMTKPAITREIEGSSGLTPEKAAQGLFEGLRKGYFAITTDFDTRFLRVAARGTSPPGNVGLDFLLGFITQIAGAQFAWSIDGKAKAAGKQLAKERK